MDIYQTLMLFGPGRFVALVSIVLATFWVGMELYSVARQLAWNWIDETKHPIQRSRALLAILKAVDKTRMPALEGSLAVLCLLMLWPVAWMVWIAMAMMRRAREARRLEKKNLAAAGALTVERTQMIEQDLRRVESKEPLLG